ncbi:MAG: deoxynucleoside kinase [Halobacteriovoraceae bacterium]|nr:deoxynucleoside kinase [Halobacteriovoraceae bacterium]
MFIGIAGNIGSGKTTLTKKLSERLACRPMFESVEDNPYLEDFYSDMNRYSFPLQVYFLNHRFNAHRLIDQNNFSAIQDRSIYEDAHIFAKNLFRQGKMSARDFENYFSLYSTVVSFLKPPTLMIFLRRSVPKLMERIAQRGRECEKDISPDYISQLNDLYDEWYNSYDQGKYLLVDTDDLDFLNNESDFNRLISKIHDTIEQKDLFLTLN